MDMKRKEEILQKIAEEVMQKAKENGYVNIPYKNKTYEFYPKSYEIHVEEEVIVFHGKWKIKGGDILETLLDIKIPDELKFIEGKYVVYVDTEKEKGIGLNEAIISCETLEKKFNEFFSFFCALPFFFTLREKVKAEKEKEN